MSPAIEAWYVLRIADYLRERLDEGSLGVLSQIEIPLVPVLATMEGTGITVNHAHDAEAVERSRRRGPTSSPRRRTRSSVAS